MRCYGKFLDLSVKLPHHCTQILMPQLIICALKSVEYVEARIQCSSPLPCCHEVVLCKYTKSKSISTSINSPELSLYPPDVYMFDCVVVSQCNTSWSAQCLQKLCKRANLLGKKCTLCNGKCLPKYPSYQIRLYKSYTKLWVILQAPQNFVE